MIRFLTSRTSSPRKRNPAGYRIGSAGRRSKPRHFRPWLEVLEDRTPLALGTGIFIEDFSDRVQILPGATPIVVPGFDGSGTFRHSTIDYNFEDFSGWGLPTNPDADPSPPHALFLFDSDQITFPARAADESVTFAKVSFAAFSEVAVTFHGLTDNFTVNASPASLWQAASVTSNHLGDGGNPVGPIQSITLFSHEALFDNVTILVQVEEANLPPQALDDSATVRSGQRVSINAVNNDTDPNGELLTITSVNGQSVTNAQGQSISLATQLGQVIVVAGTTLDYTANAGAHGLDTFTYTVNDAAGATATATVTVTVNDPPLAFDGRYTRPHGVSGQFTIPAPGLRDLVEDHDGDPLTLVLTQDSQHGHVTLDQDGSFTYTSTEPSGRILNDFFLFAANDGFVTGNTAVINVAVANQAPTTENFVFDQVARGAPFVTNHSLEPAIHDNDGDPLTITIVTPPRHGSLRLEDHNFSYFPFVGAILGTDNFTFRVNDGYVDSNVSTYEISVPNQAPVAGDLPVDFISRALIVENGVILVPADSDGVSVPNNDSYDLVSSLSTSLTSDPDGDPLSAALVDEPLGLVTVDPDGAWRYRPNVGFQGADSFTYKVADGFLDSNVATVHLSVVGPPQFAALSIERLDGLVYGFEAVVLNRNMIVGEFDDAFVIEKRDNAGNWSATSYRVRVHTRSSGSTTQRSEVTFDLSPQFLPDGHYRLTVLSNLFSGWYDVPLDGDLDGLSGGDYVIEFDSLFGDEDGDGQRDGIASQSVTLPTASGQSVTLTASPGTLIYNARATNNPPFLDLAPSAAIFPLGFFDFQIVGVPRGGPATVTLALPPGLRITDYYKLGTPYVFLQWYQFSYHDGTGAEILDDDGDGFTDRIVLHFVDGARGDSEPYDGIANGVIQDPGGPAIADGGAVQPLFTLSPLDGPRVAVPGQLVSYSVAFSDGNAVANYTTTIDWGDGTVSEGYMSVSSAGGVAYGRVSFWHTYKTLGDRVVRLTLRDGNGNIRTAELPVTVQLVTFQPDPLDSTRQSLVVGGFDSANDQIVFQPDPGGVRLAYNGYSVGPFSFDGSIVSFGQGGHDTIRVDQRLVRSAMLFGQEGNDIFVGSAGTNVLVGGTGNDQLFGYAARDLLFGGLGADVLNGHGPSPSAGDSDLLCADYAAGEYDPSLLASLHNRWQSPASYADRLYNLRYAASPALNNATVFNDFSADRLIGGAGLDWFLFSALDELVDVEEDEQGLGFPLRSRRR